MSHRAHNPELIPRPRLLHKLQDAVQGRLTLISSPPGYGKSVLARQFAEQSPIPVIWHSVEYYERDILTLCSQSVNALGRSLPDAPALAIPDSYAAHEFVTVLADYLRKLNKKIIYVLDDIHHLEGADSAEYWLRTLVNVLPSNCHLILIGRTIPQLPLIELVTRQQVMTIGTEDLRLNREEITALASSLLEHELEQVQLDVIESDLEGWPAGVALALYPPAEELQRTVLQGRSDPEALFDTLAEIMFESQPPSIQNFMLFSSVLHHMTPELLDAVLGLHNSADLLSGVWARNLFISQTHGVMSYHMLLRRFLQAQLRRSNVLKFIDLHLKAAQYFETEGQFGEAFEHYVDAEQFSYAADLADRNAEAYFEQGLHETLLMWKTALEPMQQLTPKLLLICGLVHAHRLNYPLSDQELAQAAQMIQGRSDDTFILNIRVQQSYNDLRQGRLTQANAQLTQILDSYTQPTMIRGKALWVMATVCLQAGDREKAVNYLLEAIPIYRSLATPHALSQLIHTLAMVYEQLGRLPQASACLQECIALLKPLQVKRELAMALNDLGYYFYLSNNYEQARLTYEEGLQLILHIPDPRAETYLLWNIGDLKRDLDDFVGAERVYNKALATLHKADTGLYCYLLLSMALLKRWQGQWQEVIDLTTEVLRLANGKFALQSNVAQVLLSSVSAELDKSPHHLESIETALANLRTQQARIKLLSALTIAAHTTLLCKSKSQAKAYLQEAVALSTELGIAQPIAAELAHSPSVLTFLDTLNDKAPVQQALALLQQSRTDLSYEVVETTPTLSLRVYTFGTGVVSRNGQQITASDWRSNTARALFFHLLFQGPSHRDKVTNDFWPDSTLEVARSNFHTALKRARKALGSKVISFSNELYAVSDLVHLWCDAFELETLVSQARILPTKDARTEVLFNRALQLYSGEFLLEIQQEWSRPYRERYHELYIETLLGLAACMRSRADYSAAIQVLKRGIHVEPYHEPLHRQLLQCYADRGEKSKILKHYRALLELLKNDLATQPETATQQLFHHLMN